MRRGSPTPLDLNQLAQRLGTRLSPTPFFVSPGYYAPLRSWAEASRCCGQGYQADSVVDRYRTAALIKETQNDQKDAVDPYAIRQLAALQHVWLSMGCPNPLRVMDFGGALGSHFHALSAYWPWGPLHWTVIETEAVSTAGQAEFERETTQGHHLRFSAEAKKVLASGIDVVLASCSLQYLEHWQDMLKLFKVAPWLLLDRVPLINNPTDLIDIQVVPANYTDTRYPGWKLQSQAGCLG